MKRYSTFILGLFLSFATSLFAAEETAKEPIVESIFNMENFDFEQSLVEMYRQDNLIPAKNYLQLRRLHAKKYIRDFVKDNLKNVWGTPDQRIMDLLDKHQDLLETYLTTIDLNYALFGQQMELLKKLLSEYPEIVEKNPELAIAIVVVWDEPDSWTFGLCEKHYNAVLPPDQSDAIEMFRYYSDKSAPFYARTRLLPWDFLMYVVNHKTSKEERRWVWRHYDVKKPMAGKAYNDPLIVWKSKDLGPGVYADTLVGLPYTLQNLKEKGTVCSGRADYACGVSRTLGVPAMRCSGDTKYAGGHYWVQWIEFQEVSPKKIRFTIEQCGRDDHRRDRASDTINPETAQWETNQDFTLRLVRAAKDKNAFRHGELLMKSFVTLVKYTGMSYDDQLNYLLKVNAVLPGNQKAWKEIAAFGPKKRFNKTHVGKIKKWLTQMADEMLFAPNEIPNIAKNMLDFPEIKSEEKKLYDLLFNKLASVKREDLVFAAAHNYADSLDHQKLYVEEFEMLQSLLLKHPEKCHTVEPMLDRLDAVVAKDKARLASRIVPFYQEFLNRVTKDNTRWTREYQKDMLTRAQKYFDENQRNDLTLRTKSIIARLDKDAKADGRRFEDFLDELDQQNDKMTNNK